MKKMREILKDILKDFEDGVNVVENYEKYEIDKDTFYNLMDEAVELRLIKGAILKKIEGSENVIFLKSAKLTLEGYDFIGK